MSSEPMLPTALQPGRPGARRWLRRHRADLAVALDAHTLCAAIDARVEQHGTGRVPGLRAGTRATRTAGARS